MTPKNLLWGTYTWILFHWMAHNIKNECFENEKLTILKLISSICHNLPCPDCREHAIHFLKYHNIYDIKTKEDLNYYIHYFHNLVNGRLKRKQEEKTILEKYSKVNINKLLQAWNIHFKDMNGVNLNDFMAKQKIYYLKIKVTNYIQENKHKFSS